MLRYYKITMTVSYDNIMDRKLLTGNFFFFGF